VTDGVGRIRSGGEEILPDARVQAFESPGQGVQYKLLWGLRRITGQLLGEAGRDWSFSTYELPLGGTDPGSLPSIVFREAQEGAREARRQKGPEAEANDGQRQSQPDLRRNDASQRDRGCRARSRPPRIERKANTRMGVPRLRLL